MRPLFTGLRCVRLPKAPEQFRGMLPRRWGAERTIAWLHRYKRLAIRYERRDDIPHALLDLGCALICLRRLPEAVQ